MGGGGITKKVFAQGKLNEKKIHTRQLTPKNIIHATAYKKFIKGI